MAAWAASAHPVALDGVLGGVAHNAVAAHAQIIVGAPDRYFPGLVGSVIGAPEGGGKARGVALKIGENTIAALGPQTRDRALEMRLIVDR